MKIGRLVLVILVLASITALASNEVHAASLCVHPDGAARCFPSIQEAVDAANDGDRITIRSGTYVEQIIILGKSLTLAGQPGAIIQAAPDMEDTLSSIGGVEGRPIILVAGGDVTIRDLTIDGANSAEANPFLQGITFINAGGVIRHNAIKDIGFGEPRLPINENGEPLYQGEGILVVNFEANPRTVSIIENRIVNYNNSGITVFAEADPSNPAIANLTVNVVDNTIIGWGPNDMIDQWGIFFGGFNFAEPQFSITGTLRGNRIRDQITLAPHPLPGVGIAAISTYNVEIADNVIENTNISLAANQALSARIRENQFVGPQLAAIGSTGLLLSGSDAQVVQNRFRRVELGIFLHVEDPDFGSALNTAMDENQFENVTLDMLTGPGAPFAATARIEPTRPRLRPR